MHTQTTYHPLRSAFSFGILAALAISSPAAYAGITSTFDIDDEGWTLSGDIESDFYGGETLPSLASPLHHSANGNTGGYIEHNDTSSGANIYFVAPEAYRGNLSGYAGGSLSYSLRINSFVAATPSSFVPAYDVVIVSPAATIMLPYQITLENSPVSYTLAATGEATSAGWHDYSFALTATQGWQFRFNGGGSFAPASDEQIRLVLGNVSAFTILGEYLNGTDYGNLDSVRLLTASESPAIPEPASSALLGGMAILGLAVTRRRRPPIR